MPLSQVILQRYIHIFVYLSILFYFFFLAEKLLIQFAFKRQWWAVSACVPSVDRSLLINPDKHLVGPSNGRILEKSSPVVVSNYCVG